jgi:hypothetical protein
VQTPIPLSATARRKSLADFSFLLVQRGLQTLDETVPVEGLGQVANRSGPKRLRTNPFVRKSREEYEWHTAPPGQQVRLQLDAAHARHLDIRNHTRDLVEMARPQEFFGGRERTMYPRQGLNKAAVTQGLEAYGVNVACSQIALRTGIEKDT